MKAIVIVIGVAAAALAGCTVKETVVKPAATPSAVVYAPTPTTSGAPSIAYTVMGESQFKQAAIQAATWCNSNRYGNGARLVDRQRTTGGDVVTFACTAG